MLRTSSKAIHQSYSFCMVSSGGVSHIQVATVIGSQSALQGQRKPGQPKTQRTSFPGFNGKSLIDASRIGSAGRYSPAALRSSTVACVIGFPPAECSNDYL